MWHGKWYEMTRTKKKKWDEIFWYEMFWLEKSRNHSKAVSERTVLYGSIIYKPRLISHIFLSLNKNLYVNLCDKKQIDDVKMKSGLMTQR